MNVARILFPVKVLGPGERIGIWVCGCRRRCRGCSNPELWYPREEYEITIDNLVRLINKITSLDKVDGFTISGGEPMDQAHELVDLLSQINKLSDDILLYTGYTLQELHDRSDEDTEKALSKIAVLIDGEYIEDKNNNELIRGSSNQQIHILKPCMEEKYRHYLDHQHNQIQNFTTSDGIVSVGIHRKGFNMM